MFVTDKVDKTAKLTTKVNTGGSLPHLTKELILFPQMEHNYFEGNTFIEFLNIFFLKIILVVAVDVCVGENQLGGDKRDKIGNIGAVECRTCHGKLSKYMCGKPPLRNIQYTLTMKL